MKTKRYIFIVSYLELFKNLVMYFFKFKKLKNFVFFIDLNIIYDIPLRK